MPSELVTCVYGQAPEDLADGQTSTGALCFTLPGDVEVALPLAGYNTAEDVCDTSNVNKPVWHTGAGRGDGGDGLYKLFRAAAEQQPHGENGTRGSTQFDQFVPTFPSDTQQKEHPDWYHQHGGPRVGVANLRLVSKPRASALLDCLQGLA